MASLFLKPYNLFLLIAIPFGLIYIVASPPLRTPDERAHMIKIYKFSEGEFKDSRIAKGIDDFTKQAYAQNHDPINGRYTISRIIAMASIPLLKDQLVLVRWFYNDLYSPVPYLPQIAAFMIGKACNLSPVLLMYMGRFFAFIAATLLTYISIRIIPTNQWALCFIALLPTPVYLRSSLSADSLTAALAFLFTALLFQTASLEVISRKRLLSLSIMAIGIAMCKSIYVVMLLAVLIIPRQKFDKLSGYIRTLSLITLPAFILETGWSSIAKPNVFMHLSSIVLPSATVDPDKQQYDLFWHPHFYLEALYNYLHSLGYIKSLIASYVANMGLMDRPIDQSFIALAAILVIIFTLFAKTDTALSFSLKARDRFLLLGLFGGIFILMTLANYIVWTPYRSPTIDGMQGRYLIPIIPLLLISLAPNIAGRKTLPVPVTAVLVLIGSVVLLTAGLRELGMHDFIF